MNTNLEKIIEHSVHFIEKTNYKSYDVFDALNSKPINRILKNQLFLRRVAIQLNARIPLNLRPVLGIKKMVHTKTISDLLSIYSMLYKRTQKDEFKIKANGMYEMLLDQKIEVDNGLGFGWGLGFPYTTRFTNANENTPNLYNTINATHSILDYYEVFNTIELDPIIKKVNHFILNYLGVVQESNEIAWLRYYPKQTGMPTPNVNATSASLFVRINSFLENKIPSELITQLLKFVEVAQNNDGSWFYTTTQNGQWIDGFHTGFILESLALIQSIDSSYKVENMLEKGTDFFLKELIDENGVPKYFHNKTYPIESQNCAQCIQTVAKLMIYNNQNLDEKLEKTINTVIETLYNENGYFYHKKDTFFTIKHYYARWSQTPMILSLLFSLKALKK